MSSSSFGTSEIIGAVVGGVITLVTIVGLAISCYAMCCKKNKSAQVKPINERPQEQYPYDPQQYPYGQQNPHGQQNPYGQPTNTGYYQQHPQQYYAPQAPYNAQPSYYSARPTY